MTHVPKTITEIYAWICTEPDGGDGIPAVELPGLPGMAMPMVGADRERALSLRPWAQAIRQHKGLPIRLMRFSCAEELERL